MPLPPPRGLAPYHLAIVEPWFGESHAAMFEGFAGHSRHSCLLTTLPAKKWQWRMRLGAYHLREQLDEMVPPPDALLLSDYTHLPLLKCFAPRVRDIPTAVYFLENQLTYPIRNDRTPEQRERSFEYMAINVTTCLAAERVIFCSDQHRQAFLFAIPHFLAHDPDASISDVVRRIEKKSTAIPIGVDLTRFDRARLARIERKGRPLRIVWPHRFEHDKNPEDFYDVIRSLDQECLPFEISVIGRTYRDMPRALEEMRSALSHRIAQWGFLEGTDYAEALAASDVVVSTAWQETQGIAVIEAIRAGCDPLLPNRLSYPEVLGSELSKKHLYASKGDLRRRLRWMMRHPDRVRASCHHFERMTRFGWPAVAPQFDRLIDDMVAGDH